MDQFRSEMHYYLANMNHPNALACVFLVQFSLNIDRIVTELPANNPARHLNASICQSVVLTPNRAEATPIPPSENTITGLRPSLSASRP